MNARKECVHARLRQLEGERLLGGRDREMSSREDGPGIGLFITPVHVEGNLSESQLVSVLDETPHRWGSDGQPRHVAEYTSTSCI
jgi:hypothetical protein